MQLKFHLKKLTAIIIMKMHNNNDKNKGQKSLNQLLMILLTWEIPQIFHNIKHAELRY